MWHLTNFHPLYRGTDKHLHLFILMCTRFTNNILFINIINTIYTGLFVIWYRLTSAKTNFWFSQASLFWFHRLTLFCSEVDSWIKCIFSMSVKMFCVYQSVWPFWSVQMAVMAVFFSHMCWTFSSSVNTSLLMFPAALTRWYVKDGPNTDVGVLERCGSCAFPSHLPNTRPYQLLQLATANTNDGILIV